METRRLRLLVELARLGSMRAVAEQLHTTTSAVSQQLAVLAREAGAPLVEPVGRRVRLTPAGRRLAGHAATVLAALDAARRDLDPAATPAGTVRVAGFATAVRRSLMPAVAELADRCPQVRLLIREHEPAEALALLADDEVDLALTYDYNLAPAPADDADVTPLWSARWSLAVPAGHPALDRPGAAPTLVARCADDAWIVNSRDAADEQVVRLLGSLADVTPRITHRADSLDLVQDMIAAGLGVALLPADQPVRAGIRLVALDGPGVVMRACALTRRGSGGWAPLAFVVGLLAERAAVDRTALPAEARGTTTEGARP